MKRWLDGGLQDTDSARVSVVDHGLTVGRGFGSKYVEFTAPAGQVKLALYKRRALAKNAGVSPEGSGSHRLVITNDTAAFTDPDGFVWDVATA